MRRASIQCPYLSVLSALYYRGPVEYDLLSGSFACAVHALAVTVTAPISISHIYRLSKRCDYRSKPLKWGTDVNVAESVCSTLLTRPPFRGGDGNSERSVRQSASMFFSVKFTQ